jgi:hypothetical protein
MLEDGEEIFLHIEFQSAPDQDMPERQEVKRYLSDALEESLKLD